MMFVISWRNRWLNEIEDQMFSSKCQIAFPSDGVHNSVTGDSWCRADRGGVWESMRSLIPKIVEGRGKAVLS